MKYFIDTEFIEGFHKPLFGKRRHFIDLISIGIVAEDGREYYAISNEFNPKDADDWVKENVISKLPERNVSYYDSPRMKSESLLWKSNKQIMCDIVNFICPIKAASEWAGIGSLSDGLEAYLSKNKPEFYGYYSDYDWVVFCSLFGKMIDLPKGFPMYCKDLKQMMDDNGLSKEWKRMNCPDPEGEHNALVDAKWNKKLFEAIALKNATFLTIKF